MLSPELLAERQLLETKCNSTMRIYRAALKAAEADGLTIAGRVEAMNIAKASKLEYNAASGALTAFRKANPGR